MMLFLAALTFAAAETTQFNDPVTGALRLETGTLSAPLQGELLRAAQGFAMARADRLKLPVTSSLEVAEGFATRFGGSIHLEQRALGLPVYGAKVVVTVDSRKQVTIVSSSVVPYEQAVVSWATGPDEALRIAGRELSFVPFREGKTPYGGWKRALFAVGANVHSGYLVHVPTLDPSENWHFAIDATTGAVLWKENRVFNALDARTYKPSPGGLDAGVGVTPTVPVSLQHADGGSMVSNTALVNVAGTLLTLPNDAGYLFGTQVVAFNCCPSAGCDGGSPKRVDGGGSFGGINVNFDVAVCDPRPRASNHPLLHDAGSYVYPPIDPPALNGMNPVPPTQSSLADSDEFSEVNAFYQVNVVYDWVRGLSAKAKGSFPTLEPFKMRDEKRTPTPRQPAVWTNVTLPDFRTITDNPLKLAACALGAPCTIDTLARLDNAAFMPKENFEQFVVPGYSLDTDALLIFQGDRADFGYDAPVLWHEFGHGVINSTAKLNLGTVALDAWSANNEGGALHEAFADYLAAAFGENPNIGQYVGPRIGNQATMVGIRTDSYLRTVDNTFKCPDVLWGEVHQDSQHVSGALWKARKTEFQGSDMGATFDATIYASLVAMSPTTGFAQMAAIVSTQVGLVFGAGAAAKMQAIWDEKAVTGCSKVVDVMNASGPRPLYIVQGNSSLTGGGVVPGPYQLKVATPNGARDILISASRQAAGLGIPGVGGGTVVLPALAKPDSRLVFTQTSGGILNDSTARSDASGTTALTWDIKFTNPVRCGADSFVYVTIGNGGANAESLRNLTVSVVAPATCPVSDAGAADSGTAMNDGGSSDGGNIQTPDASVDGGTGTSVPAGCGCGQTQGLWPFAVIAMLFAAWRTRRRYDVGTAPR